MTQPPARRWPAHIARHLKTFTIDADDYLDAESALPGIVVEVQRDRERPTLGEAAADAAKETAKEAIAKAVAPKGQ